MSDQKSEMGKAELLYVALRALAHVFFWSGALSLFFGWTAVAPYLFACAFLIWLLRAGFIGPAMKMIIGKKRLRAAWQNTKDRT